MPTPNSKTTNVKFLKMTFKNNIDKTTSVQIPYPRTDLEKGHITILMDLLINKNIFLKKGVSLVSKKSAEIIERTVTTQDFVITVE